MSETDKDSKTELPSEKRLNEAFEKGQFAKSAELQVVATLAAMLGVIGFFLSASTRDITSMAVLLWSDLSVAPFRSDALPVQLTECIRVYAGVLLPVIVAVGLGTLLMGGFQSGFRMAPKAIGLKVENLDFTKGFGRVFSKSALVKSGIDIRIVDTDIVFDHAGYADPAALAGKTERNRRIIEAALAKEPDGDPNLRYFHASTFFDTRRFAEAAGEYEECARRSRAGRTRLARAATLKAAQAWFLAGEHDRARALLPDHVEPGLHPLAAHLRAELAVLAGNPADAVPWQESVLGAPDTAYLPPESLAPLKFKAMLFLANHWAGRGRKDIGVKLLRLAQDISLGKRDGASPALAAGYREASRAA